MHQIYIPLAYNVAMVLHKEDYALGPTLADQRMVGIVNCLAVAKARRFICSPGKDFVCMLPDKSIGNGEETIEMLRMRGSFKDD